jgi:hypothetical protein
VDEQGLGQDWSASTVVAAEWWKIEIAQQRMTPNAVTVAERRHPGMLACVHIDGGHA